MAKINRKEILSKLTGDVTSAEGYKSSWDDKRAKWVSEYNGDPYGNESVGKATVVSRDIKKAAAWQHAAIIDPFVSNDDIISCSPITYEDRAAATQAELLLNFQFCRDFDRYQFISNSFKVLQREGTVVAKVGWERQEKEKEVTKPIQQIVPMQSEEMMQQYMEMVPEQAERMQQQMSEGKKPYAIIVTGTETVMEDVVVYNRPTLELCRNSMLWIDPTAEGNIEDAQFVAYKFKSNMSELRKDGRYKNLDKIKMKNSSRDFGSNPYKTTDEGFAFSDEPREELDVTEYWGNYDLNGDGIAEPIVCTWVNDIIIRLENNPYPDQKVPFVSCAYDSEPFSINGEANAEMISTDQKIKTGIKRAILDTLDSSTNGQKANKKGGLDPINLKKFREGKYFEYNGQAPEIWEGKFQEIPASIMNFYGVVNNDIESLTGVKSFNAGIGGASLGSSATATRGILDATAKREMDISRNYKETFLVPIMRKWLSMSQEFMEEEQVIRITNEEFVPVRRDDLDGNIDIGMEVSTPEADAEKSSKIAFLLQTTAQSLPFDLTKMLLAKQSDLNGMPDLAKQIMEYSPQPDPLEQERKQLEVDKLKAEIAERQSRADENIVDMRKKTADAVLAEAKAREIHSVADIKDQDFLDKQTGITHQRELEKQGQKIGGDLMKQRMATASKTATE